MMEEFQQSFFEDARDLLKQLEQALLTLESDPEDPRIIEEIFRVMHTIKGAANMFGFEIIGEFTHDIETIYDSIRSNEAYVDEVILNLTFQSVDHIQALLNDPQLKEGLNQSNHHSLKTSVQQIIQEIEQGSRKLKTENLAPEVPAAGENECPTFYLLIRPNEPLTEDSAHPLFFVLDDLKESGSHRLTPHFQKVQTESKTILYWDLFLSTEKSEEELRNSFIFVEDDCALEIHRLAEINLLKQEKFLDKAQQSEAEDVPLNLEELQAYVHELQEEIRTARLSAIREEEDNKAKTDKEKQAKKGTDTSIRVATDKVDKLMNWVSELVTMQATINSIATEHKIPQLQAAAENMEVITENLRDTVFSITLLPLDTITVTLKRLVRNLGKELNKDVEFRTEGTDTELDKNVIEALTDPLMHMLRNCMDHGLETGEERASTDKPARGYILLKAYYSGANVFIEVHDDGRGIDPEKIRARALEKGLINEDDQLSRDEIYQLLFKPGFSTAAQVTDVSGRGVGMDVVKKKIHEIRGDVSVYSEIGQGTSMVIRLPLTLSIIDGLLTQVDNTFFVLPLNLVSSIEKVPFEEVKRGGRFSRSLVVEGRQMSVLSLRETFNMHEHYPAQATIVSIQDGKKEKGIVVDIVKGELQAVLKPLGSMYEDQDYISGGTILGDGNLALVLDTNKLISRYASEETLT
jgi:two-component system chemotaxis sensor kinase CheA